MIGTYSTTTTANKDRNKNIELAAEALNGLILQPGEEFSFNKATGERSEAKGYRPAGAYVTANWWKSRAAAYARFPPHSTTQSFSPVLRRQSAMRTAMSLLRNAG